jgi:DNA modification methylase
MTDTSNIDCIIEIMDLTKLSKPELLVKCQELGITKCKSKNKGDLINLINNKVVEQKNVQPKNVQPNIMKPKNKKLIIECEDNHEPEDVKENEIQCIITSDIKGNNVKKKGNLTCLLGDCLIELDNIPDKSIQSVIIDPPYNIGKDTWDNIDNYIEWLTSVIVKLQSKMKDNGSLFVFHNDMEQISELMVSIKKNSKLIFKQMIVWNKRFETSKKKGFLDGFIVKNVLHNWNKMAEYILYYTFDNSWKLLNARKEKNVSQLTISKEILSKTNGLTGWYSNLETGKNMPTEDTIKPITRHLGLTLDDLVPKYNNLKRDHSVWNYDMAKRCDVHVTPKPTDLLENIILHTTDPSDIILDCFAGSGSIAQACLNTNRRCIMIEKEKKYYDYITEQYGLS